MANFSEAYDFALFEERTAAAPAVVEQPQRQPRRGPQRSPRENVVELPRHEAEKRVKPKRRPFRFLAASVCFLVVSAIVASVVHSQVLLTELTQEINNVTDSLAKAESVEIQLSMQAALRMNDGQIEKYAASELGLSKISGAQVTYINVARADQGQVLGDLDGGSVLDRLWGSIRGLFAR